MVKMSVGQVKVRVQRAKQNRYFKMLVQVISGVAAFSLVCPSQHMTRTFHDLDGNVIKRDSGIWINGFDYTGMSHITPHVPEINDTIRAHCEEDAPLCGFPWYLPVHFLIRFVCCQVLSPRECSAIHAGSHTSPVLCRPGFPSLREFPSFSGIKYSEVYCCFFKFRKSSL